MHIFVIAPANKQFSEWNLFEISTVNIKAVDDTDAKEIAAERHGILNPKVLSSHGAN